MNSLPPLSLPRFHVNALSQSHKKQTSQSENLPAEKDFQVASDDQPSPEDPEAESDPIEALLAPPPPEIDTGTILNSLEAAVSGLQKEALTHSQTLVGEFLRAAFPNLCEAFLADEVMQATNAMMPNEIGRLVLKVPAAFEPAFQRALQASPEMTAICELQTHGHGDDIIVDVDWRTGGLHFDMNQFLESSLARLAGPTHAHEGHNV